MTAKYHNMLNYVSIFLLLSLSPLSHAGSPVWTFTPLTATTVAVTATGTATIEYQVTNHSKKSHTLAMKDISGVSQDTSSGHCANLFTLGYQQSCILSLIVNGSTLQGSVVGGPVVCQQGSALQCYQPSTPDALNVSLSSSTNGATLSTSVSTLGLSVNYTAINPALTGRPRLITITNTGVSDAINVQYSISPALPTGTTISPTSCGTIAASGTCVLTITPGSTASATAGNTNPTPITLSISGTNTNTLTPTINVLIYGSVYQGGYIYSINDTTPNTGSVGGSVVTKTNQAQSYPNGILWSSNGTGIAEADVSYDIIPGIAPGAGGTYVVAQATFNTTYSNTMTYPFPPSSSFSLCASTNGACNSANILTLYNTYSTQYGVGSSPYALSTGPTTLTYYAAGLCSATISGYSDWYLPSICQMGPNSNGSGCVSSTQNIVNQLPYLLGNPDSGASCAYGGNCISGYYWSSTELSSNPRFYAWVQKFSSGGSSQSSNMKNYLAGVRCSRDLTL